MAAAANGNGAAGGARQPPPPVAAAQARLAMMELVNMISVPMSLTAIVRLGVPDALSRSPTPLTAAEILPLLRPPQPPASSPSTLQRLLRLLSSHGVFAEDAPVPGEDRKYSLTEIGRTLVSGGDDRSAPSYAAYVLQHHQEALVRAWPRLHEAVGDPTGPEPFARANGGVGAYEYYGGDPEANDLMQRAMWGVSVPFMEALIDGYGGFAGVGTIVDVGGSSGECLGMIVRRVSGVEAGVNFDLPEVVARAPAVPGVTHVGGDMFKSIPKGDAIFMKWVLMTWTDKECRLILKNCYDALPEGRGKVVACEPVLPEETDSSCRTRALLENDIFVMATYRVQGRGRTEEEFRKIGISVGFQNFSAIYLDPFYTVLEFQK